MKNFFTKISKSPLAQKPPSSGLDFISGQVPAVPTLQPKFMIPPVPHPCPYDHIAVLVTVQGLLLRPHVPGIEQSGDYVRVAWTGGGAKGVVVKAAGVDGEGRVADWTESAIVYGIVGILELFSTSYLLVITAKSDVGHLFDPTHAVYAVKGVTAIPLVEERARIAVNTLLSRNAALGRPSLLPSDTVESIDTDDALKPEGSVAASATPKPLRAVQFARESQSSDPPRISTSTPTIMEEDDSLPPSPSGSGGSTTPSFELLAPNTPISRVIASKLSFWKPSLKPAATPDTHTASLAEEPSPLTLAQEEEAIRDVVRDGKYESSVVLDSILSSPTPSPTSMEERHTELEQKIVRECIREFTKGGMYFAYTFDITRSLQHKQEQVAKCQKQHNLLVELNALDENEAILSPMEKVDVLAEPFPTLPLWRRVDRQFWWNEWLSKPFIEAGLHSYVLPIMQGYYQIASFPIAREPVALEEGDSVLVDYIVISRRSRERAGLRYQRRGVDDDAHVANFVETETIMRVEREGYSNVFGYAQLRGSIPLFWSQTGYGLKPSPQLSPERTHAQNLDALKRHLEKTVDQYGPHTIVNLAEQQGREGAITHAYAEFMQELSWKESQYHEYDFHHETRGMKYENIQNLIETMERTFEHQGYLWISNDIIMSKQKGVFRVNCIDCLDRTNVVQSAFARHVLDIQLGAVALLNTSEEGKTEMDIVFNDMWANNGDAISRAYAGTSALKGDFTRTGKRDLSGLLNDGVNSLARMYTSTFSDWFCQAVLDFMLGNRTVSVFSEFLLKLQSTDPRELVRISKIRADAISTCVERVLIGDERYLAGWTLFSPQELNARMGDRFEEKILLLTVKAIYIVSYDYTLEKVKMYTRVPLGDIIGISKGAYILSPLEEASRDPLQNAGFVLSWRSSNQTTRVTSYSVRNSLGFTSPPSSPRDRASPGRAGPSPLSKSMIFQMKGPAPASPVSPLSKSMLLYPSSLPAAASQPKTPLTSQSTSPVRKGTRLSRLLSSPVLAQTGEETFAAFKALPLELARIRRTSSSGGAYVEPAAEVNEAKNCKEVVDTIVEAIHLACSDIGNCTGNFVTDEDVVGLAQAHRMTSMYAKMEYGVKRLLWLGG